MRKPNAVMVLFLALTLVFSLVRLAHAYDGEGDGPNPYDSYDEGTVVQCYENVAVNDGTKMLGCTVTERDSIFFLVKNAAKIEGDWFTFFVSTQTNVICNLAGTFENGKYVHCEITHKDTYSERPAPAGSATPTPTATPVVTTTVAPVETTTVAPTTSPVVTTTAVPVTTSTPKPSTPRPNPTATPKPTATPDPTELPWPTCQLQPHLGSEYGWR